mmetsp:Transcript_28221/g.61084  ORF Transcript_28221/g.61084 Transcript_28221/m.61084 type:complete len:140 (+) Transcript_28221:2-421(+)
MAALANPSSHLVVVDDVTRAHVHPRPNTPLLSPLPRGSTDPLLFPPIQAWDDMVALGLVHELGCFQNNGRSTGYCLGSYNVSALPSLRKLECLHEYFRKEPHCLDEDKPTEAEWQSYLLKVASVRQRPARTAGNAALFE